MKIKNLILGLVVILSLTSSANAVTLVAGNSYALTGSIYGVSSNNQYTGTYSLNSPGLLSYFTVNFDNTITVVLNLIQADGDKAKLTIDKLVLGGTGATKTMNAPAGVTTYATYSDIGNFFPANNPGAFTNVAIGMAGQLDTAGNGFHIWPAFYSQAGVRLGATDFHLGIGGIVNPGTGGGTQIPEPMSMSLLGLGLLGGAIRRKFAA